MNYDFFSSITSFFLHSMKKRFFSTIFNFPCPFLIFLKETFLTPLPQQYSKLVNYSNGEGSDKNDFDKIAQKTREDLLHDPMLPNDLQWIRFFHIFQSFLVYCRIHLSSTTVMF